jgi:hypothetical protein
MKSVVSCIGVLLVLSLQAQVPLTNETIFKLVKAGIGEDTIVGMVNQQPGRYALSADDMIALKKAGASDKIIAAMVIRNEAGSTPALQSVGIGPATSALLTASATSEPLILHDATPIRLRLNRNLSSADARAGDSVDFEVLDDMIVDDVLLIPRGGTAIATITQAEAKKRMARGGKLDINIDYVRLVNGDKVAVRAVKEGKGGGHTGAMTGAMVATSLVFFPAAPFFLFMHGKDVIIPKGTPVTAYVDGEIKLDRAKFVRVALPQQSPAAQQPIASKSVVESPPLTSRSTALASSTGLYDITFTSTPSNALVTIAGQPIGRTPFTTKIPPGIYKTVCSFAGDSVEKTVTVGPGYSTTVNMMLNR